MNYDTFVKTYLGKSSDYDGAPAKDPVQCVDLAKFYLRDCYGIKSGAWGNARDYYECFSSPSWAGYKTMNVCFTRIANTKTFIPMKGDIAVWGAGLSKYGHIAICTGEGTTSTFKTIDQNWGGKSAKYVTHNYNGFLGVLRPKRTVRANVNIRSGAGTTYSILGEKKKGEKVTVYQIAGSWARIGEGQWIHVNYITSI